MSTYQRANFSAAITRIAGYSRNQIKESITKNKLSIKKNLSTEEMRKQLIKIATNLYTKEVVAFSETPAGKKIAKAVAAPMLRKLQPNYYFVSFQMKIWMGQGGYFADTLYSFISNNRGSKAEAKEKFIEWCAGTTNKPYPDELEKITQISSMNVPLKNAQQRKLFAKLSGTFQGNELKHHQAEFQKMIVDLKLKQQLYREVRKIDGFPDHVDKRDGLCVPNFLAKELKYDRTTVDAWFRNRWGDLYDFIGGDAAAYTAQDMIDFCNDHKRSYYLLDKKNYCFSFNVSEVSKKCVLYAMIEDSHVYPIENTSARRSIAKKVSDSIAFAKGNKGDNTVKASKKGEDRENGNVIQRWVPEVREEDLFEIDNRDNLTKEEIEELEEQYSLKPGGWMQTTGNNLNHMLGWFLSRNYIPTIEYSEAGITSISFNTTRVVINPEYDECTGTNYSSHSSLAFASYEKLRTEHPEIMSAQYGGVAPAKHWVSEEIDPETHIGLDFSKFYYSCAMRLSEKIPVFSVGSKQKCEEFTDDNSFYYVITSDNKLFRGCDYYTCEIIKLAIAEGIEFSIDHKLAPESTYEPKLIKDELASIVEQFGGDLARAKKSLVRFIGLLARNKTSNVSAYLVSSDPGNDSSLMYHYLTELSRGKEVQVHMGTFPGVHLITAYKHKQHSVSCGTAHRAILNRSYIEMYQLLQREKLWEKVRGVKTDCAVFRRDEMSEESARFIMARTIVHQGMEMKIESPRASKIIEMEKREPMLMKCKKVVPRRESEYIKEFWKNFEFPDVSEFPWMNNVIIDIIKALLARKFCRVEAIAGAGKTYIAERIAEFFTTIGIKTMKLASDWQAASNFGGCTFHTRFQLGNNAKHWFKSIVCGDLSNTLIIIDEVGKLDKHLIALVDYLRKHAFAVIVLGDCEHQLLSVEASGISVEQSLAEFVDEFFILEMCKRGRDIMEPALRLFAGEKYEDIGYNAIDYNSAEELADQYIAGGFERLICKSNAFRNTFNSCMVEKLSTGIETREVSIETNINVKEKKTITTKVFVGMKLVSVCNRKELGIIKSDRATVMCLKPFTVIVERGTELKTIVFEETARKPLSMQLKGMFDIGYAITCYKSQSATYGFKYMITDFQSMCKRERFVATTRATQFGNIVIAKLI